MWFTEREGIAPFIERRLFQVVRLAHQMRRDKACFAEGGRATGS